MNRKPKSNSYVQPMPRKQFLRLMHEFKEIGGKYICNKETEEFLSLQKAEAMTIDGFTILFSRRPSRAAVYEELFHAKQFRNGKINGSFENMLTCEVEAQEYLLNNAKILELTDPEIIQTRQALEWYRQKLTELKGEET